MPDLHNLHLLRVWQGACTKAELLFVLLRFSSCVCAPAQAYRSPEYLVLLVHEDVPTYFGLHAVSNESGITASTTGSCCHPLFSSSTLDVARKSGGICHRAISCARGHCNSPRSDVSRTGRPKIRDSTAHLKGALGVHLHCE